MTAGDAMRPYFDAARAVIPFLGPTINIRPDLPPGSAPDAESYGVTAAGVVDVACRADYPSPAGDPPWRAVEMENTFDHEFAHGLKARIKYMDPARNIDAEYWAFRGFPGTYAAAAAAVMGPGGYMWIADPNESWAECIGAAIAGRWTKPEKTLDYGRPVDAMAARAWITAAVARYAPPTPPVVVVAPPPAPPAPSVPPAPATGVRVVDIGGSLPFDAAYLPWPITAPKDSVTVHWPGEAFDAVTDDDVINLMAAFAQYHIDKDWAADIPGAQHGAGIMYAEAIAPSGTVLLMRDPDAVLWHSDDAMGNTTSRPILVVVPRGGTPTSAQLRSLRSRVVAHGLPAYPHSKWTSTTCPGDALRAFLAGGMKLPGVLDMDEQRLREILREEVTRPITGTIASGFNRTLAIIARRVIRSVVFLVRSGAVVAGPRDPAGMPAPGGPVAYPDDETPIT